MTMIELLIDTRGLRCPLPVLRARKAMRALPAGGLARLLATDPGTRQDIAAMCAATGDTLLESNAEAGVITFLIRKAG